MKSQPIINSFFATPILFLEDLILAEKMLPLAKKFLEKKELISDSLGYRSTYDRQDKGLEQFDEFKEFAEFISTTAGIFLNNIGYDFKNKLKSYIFVSEMLAGHHHSKHPHPGALVSGVFYLQVPKNSSNIIFYDPRAFQNCMGLSKKENNNSFVTTTISVEPKVGGLLMWQSWLEHSVPTNKSEEARITLVFNCF